MEFTYRHDFLSKGMAFWYFALIVVSIIGWLYSRIELLEIAIAGALILISMEFFINKYKEFVFRIEEDALIIANKKRVARFPWSNFLYIREDRDGLVFKVKGDAKEFPILNKIRDYEKFKALVKEKAEKYSVETDIK